MYIPWNDWEFVRNLGRSNSSVYEIIRKDEFEKSEKAAMKVVSIPNNQKETETLLLESRDIQSVREVYKKELENVLKEYTLLSQMKGHSNIVSVEDRAVVEHGDHLGWDLYIRMELLTPLAEILKKRTLSEDEIIKLGKNICSALAVCHSKGIIHKNIKPDSIFLSKTGDFKLGEFGAAKHIGHTVYSTAISTQKFIAPEIIKHRKSGREADIYSLGMVMYWLMNNKNQPFLDTDKKLNRHDIKAAEEKRINGENPLPLPANGSAPLQRIVMKALSYEPKMRFKNAEDMLKALNTIGNTEETPKEEESNTDIPNVISWDDGGKTIIDLPQGGQTDVSGSVYAPVSADWNDSGTVSEIGYAKDMSSENRLSQTVLAKTPSTKKKGK